MRAMFAALDALVISVETGSGNWHCYTQWQPNLPAKLLWDSHKVGELQRGGTGPDGTPVWQQVVLPPSVHPTTGRAYQWRIDPREPLLLLPETWRTYLLASTDQSPVGDPRGVAVGDGALPKDLLRRALQQPGARERGSGVKFQCPGCRAEGHDRHMDNALVRLDGRWGCALNAEHRRAIGEALGVVLPAIPDGVLPGPVVTVTAAALDADWAGNF